MIPLRSVSYGGQVLRRNRMMKTLKEIGRETYGHDGRAINKHSDRTYRDGNGNLYVLSRTLDGCPPFFEAYGPYQEDHQGLLPRLRVGSKDYPPSLGSYGGLCWGGGWTWKQAIQTLCAEIGARVMKGDESHV